MVRLCRVVRPFKGTFSSRLGAATAHHPHGSARGEVGRVTAENDDRAR